MAGALGRYVLCAVGRNYANKILKKKLFIKSHCKLSKYHITIHLICIIKLLCGLFSFQRKYIYIYIYFIWVPLVNIPQWIDQASIWWGVVVCRQNIRTSWLGDLDAYVCLHDASKTRLLYHFDWKSIFCTCGNMNISTLHMWSMFMLMLSILAWAIIASQVYALCCLLKSKSIALINCGHNHQPSTWNMYILGFSVAEEDVLNLQSNFYDLLGIWWCQFQILFDGNTLEQCHHS